MKKLITLAVMMFSYNAMAYSTATLNLLKINAEQVITKIAAENDESTEPANARYYFGNIDNQGNLDVVVSFNCESLEGNNYTSYMAVFLAEGNNTFKYIGYEPTGSKLGDDLNTLEITLEGEIKLYVSKFLPEDSSPLNKTGWGVRTFVVWNSKLVETKTENDL